MAGGLCSELLRDLPIAAYATDAEGRVTFVNKAAISLLSSHPRIGESACSASWRPRTPEGREATPKELPLSVALRERRPVRNAAITLLRSDGSLLRATSNPTPLFDASGALVGATDMLIPVIEEDEEDASETARLLRASRRLSAIVESSDDAIVSKDLNGIIASWNQGAERLFGYAAHEAIGRSIEMLIPPDRLDEEPQIIARIRNGERVEHFETVRLRKDGGRVDISLTISPIRDSVGRIVGASKIARDITERKQAELRQQLLTREIQHRTKNLFAVVQVVVTRSFTGKDSVEAARDAVLDRLRSLSQAHDMLLDSEWRGAALSDLVDAELKPYADRVMVGGPEVTLSSKAAQSFTLALHELATNAAKYGALSSPDGRVTVDWSIEDAADVAPASARFSFRWTESGGPAVSPPERRGFGSTVLEQVMTVFFETPPRLEFDSDGLRYEIQGPLDAIAIDRSIG